MKKEEKAGVVYAPAQQQYTLSSGRPVLFVQPDLYAIARGGGDMPNAIAADILALIYQGRRETDPAQLFLGNQQHTAKLFHAAQAVIEPRLKLEDDDEAGIIDRREVSMVDLGAAYTFLLYGPAQNEQSGTRAQPSTDEAAAE